MRQLKRGTATPRPLTATTAAASTPRRRPRWAVRCVLRESPTAAPSRLRRTKQIFESIVRTGDDAGGAGGQTTYDALRRADAAWQALKTGSTSETARVFVTQNGTGVDFIDYDVVVCGGTLGIFLACTLQAKGLRVAVVERGRLKGRQQEWNISRRELHNLAKAGVLEASEVESCVTSEWERVRAGFFEGHEVWTTGVLNIGVSPVRLIEKCRAKFVEMGGVVFEGRGIEGVELHRNGVEVRMTDSQSQEKASGRLLLDCMGHFSPIVRQSRQGQQPDGVCLVVGTCATGFAENDFSDLIKTNRPILPTGPFKNRVQYFWEAFPAGSGPRDRTTYMFAYVDATPERPGLEDMFEDYWTLMPDYQRVNLDDLQFQRALFGFFPTYKDSPLQPRFDRVVHVGDAGGLQSPLSFGGFGAMLRHLERHTEAISSALNANVVDKDSLSLINPYNPGLSATWLFQKAMSAQEHTPSDLINEILSNNFRVMDLLGPRVLLPFLQDVMRFGPLSCTLLMQLLINPLFLVTATQVFGAGTLLEWLPHYLRLGGYELLSSAAGPLKQVATFLPPRDMYKLQRYADALQYGCGSDYDH